MKSSRFIAAPKDRLHARSVPHKTAHARKLAELVSLFLRRAQGVCATTKSHIKLNIGYVVTQFKPQDLAFLPGMNAGVSREANR